MDDGYLSTLFSIATSPWAMLPSVSFSGERGQGRVASHPIGVPLGSAPIGLLLGSAPILGSKVLGQLKDFA